MIVQSDVTAGMAWLIVQNPGWQVGGDMDGAKAEQTRRKLYDMVATDRILIAAYHLPFPGLGYIEKAGDGYRFVPAPWNPSI
jgi:hypothetical protein